MVLLGRLLLAGLLLWAGYMQVLRMQASATSARLGSSSDGHHHGFRDPHDNTWWVAGAGMWSARCLHRHMNGTAGGRWCLARGMSRAPDCWLAHPPAAGTWHPPPRRALLQLLLAIPLVLGWQTQPVALLLTALLGAEALLCWHWWWPPAAGWPDWAYAQHVRDHFFTNTAVAGGALLLQSFGPGVISVDHLLHKEE